MKITIDNYYPEYNKLNKSKFPAILAEGHEFVNSASNNGMDWSAYHQSVKIRSAIDTYLQKLNEYVSSLSSGKSRKTKASNAGKSPGMKQAQKDAGEYHSYTPEHLHQLLQWEKDAELEHGLTPEIKIRKDAIEKAIAAKAGKSPAMNQAKKDAEEYHNYTLEHLKQLLQWELDAEQEHGLTPEIKVRKSAIKKAIAAKAKEKPLVHAQGVEHIQEEVRFIKRVVALHNRKKEPKHILNLIKALQKSIVQKFIRKTSPLADWIRKIQDALIDMYNKMEGAGEIKIPDKFLTELVAIAGGEQVYASIGFIKRYIGMQGHGIELKKRAALIKAIEGALAKGKLDEDPYADKVKAMLNSLKEHGNAQVVSVSIGNAELNGLQKIVKDCGCYKGIGHIYHTGGKKLRPCNARTYSDAPGRGTCSHNKGLSGILTAEQMVSRHFETLPISGRYAQLIGQPGKNFCMMLHGEPGAGKTTFVFKFIKYLSALGLRILYVSSEEFDSMTINQKIEEYLNPLPSNIYFSSYIQGMDLSAFDIVVMDSVNDLGLDLEDFKQLKKQYPHTAYILMLQHTKDGQYRGGKEWEHEAEIAGKVSDGNIDIYKNRYGVKGSMYFFDSPAYAYRQIA